MHKMFLPCQVALGVLLVAFVHLVTSDSRTLAQPAGTSVGVGTVLAWWTTDPLQPLPDGYLACDGSVVTDARSPLQGQNLPDLRGRFTRGGTAMNANTVGGSETHTHGIPEHDHTLSGSLILLGPFSFHSHSWSTWNTSTNNWTFPSGPATTWNDGLDDSGSGDYPIMREDADPSTTYVTSTESHSHPLGTMTTGLSSPAEEMLGLGDNLPPYFKVLFIMKVR